MQQVVLLLFKKQYHLTQLKDGSYNQMLHMMASKTTDLRSWLELSRAPKTHM